MSDETTPDLRQMIVNAILLAAHVPGSSDCDCEPALVIEASLMEGNRIIDVEATPEALADVAMAVVRQELDQRDAEIRRLHTLFDEAKQSLPIEQRRLLAISRMVFDGIAEGHPFTRDEAADLAQRIVDEIGHSVTDEPALGPSFRVEIRRLQELISRMRADYHTEIRQRAEAHQAAIASTAGDALEHRLCGMNLNAAIRRAEQAEAAIARVREVHPRETTGFGSDVCGICFNEHEDSATWPCPTIAALERSDLPAVRAFAAKFDPREEET